MEGCKEGIVYINCLFTLHNKFSSDNEILGTALQIKMA